MLFKFQLEINTCFVLSNSSFYDYGNRFCQKSKQLRKEYQQSIAQATQLDSEVLSNMRIVRSFQQRKERVIHLKRPIKILLILAINGTIRKLIYGYWNCIKFKFDSMQNMSKINLVMAKSSKLQFNAQ
ncbi:unnamed protein product [Paramecium octaurelia]|uniref:Transmembrane protein n=1 Tax=Paramecium octaurelia TaxID=43137 RepID=A0A8S1VP27_PAROT|nr:unnamed protein product [Paramecium octaurelia]